MGIIRRSSRSWASPLHCVKKKDGSWRPCGNYRRLNTVTIPDPYPIPPISNLASNLAGMKFFSKLDLIKGYHQVPVSPDDVPKTVIITHFGLFEYLRMPFGLRNSWNTFQQLLDRVMQGLPYTIIYIDNILIASQTYKQHLLDIEKVLNCLQALSFHLVNVNLENKLSIF